MNGDDRAKADEQIRAEVFDLEMDLIETINLTTHATVELPRDAPLISMMARWARSRGAVAPLPRG